jgi:hypothetical protein
MTGQKALTQLRLQGFKTESAFLLDYPAKEWPMSQQLRNGAVPALHIAGDDPAFADCRFLTGMRIHLHADDPSRAVAWVDRLLVDGVSHIVQTTQGETFEWRA